MKRAGEFKNLVNVKPVILMSYELRSQIMAFVNGTNASECQWFHTIDKITNQRGDRIIYTLRGMYIPEQEVTGATVESPEKGMFALWNELKAKHLKEDGTADIEAVNGIVSHMHAWCHSHVNMACSPSGTDESTFRGWIKQNDDQGISSPVIMMIVNKREEVYIKLYDPEAGLFCENPDIEIVMPSVDTTYVEEAIKNKVKSKSYSSNYAGYQTGFSPVTGPRTGGQTWTPSGQAIGTESPRVITGTGVTEPGKTQAPNIQTTSRVETPSEPTIVRAGRTMLGAGSGNLDVDLLEVATMSRCNEQAERITLAVCKALDDDSELYIFSLILKGETAQILKLVQSPKSVIIPSADELVAEINALITESWYEHPNSFYANVCGAYRIANSSGKPQKRVKESEEVIKELINIAQMYESPLSSVKPEEAQ